MHRPASHGAMSPAVTASPATIRLCGGSPASAGRLANTVGVLIFGGIVALRSRAHFWTVTIIGALASGIGTWLFGRPAVHIGASGVVFAYFGYLLFTGFFERRIASLLLSIAVFIVWGPTIYGVLPIERDISWEGHLFGFIGGIVAAWALAGRPLRGGI